MLKEISRQKMPRQLREFLQTSFENGCVVPKEHLDSFVQDRVNFDENRSLYGVTASTKHFLQCYFILCRTLIVSLTNKDDIKRNVTTIKKHWIKRVKVACKHSP